MKISTRTINKVLDYRAQKNQKGMVLSWKEGKLFNWRLRY